MTLLRPLWMQASEEDAELEYPALQDRASLLSSVFSREGVLDPAGGQLEVTQRGAGANFSVDIDWGRAAIQGDDIADQGMYVVTNTVKKNRTVPAPPASGTRTHRVVARIQDKLHNGSWTDYGWSIEVLPDTGSGIPALPPSAISLARIVVGANAPSITDAMITDERVKARVGTPDVSGNLPILTNNLDVGEGSRHPAYHVSADGWVSLAGWCRQKLTFNYQANATHVFTQVLPDEVRPDSYRDFIGITPAGACHLSVPGAGVDAGKLCYRFERSLTITGGQFWWSFDGAGFRL